MALAEDVALLVSTQLHAVQSAAVAEAIVADVYRDFEREAEDHPGAGAGAGNLTYGELTLPTLRRLLVHPAVAECIEGANSRGGGGRKSDGGGGTGGTGGTFVDVGSGSGRVSVAAALLVEFDTVLGVEVDEDWHAVASAARERLLAHADAGFIRASELMFVCADAVVAAAKTWVEAADVAYICCTCFGCVSRSRSPPPPPPPPPLSAKPKNSTSLTRLNRRQAAAPRGACRGRRETPRRGGGHYHLPQAAGARGGLGGRLRAHHRHLHMGARHHPHAAAD